MKIVKIKAAGLRGGTPEGGWANEIKPQDCVHTLVAVFTDEGITGWGSVFSDEGLVQAALRVLEPLYTGENPLEPERVSEKLHTNTFWMGRGGTITHTISGIDIAMTLLRPDPTFYASPKMAAQAPPERLGYVTLINPKKQGRADAIGVVDTDPDSKSYGRLIGQTDMSASC